MINHPGGPFYTWANDTYWGDNYGIGVFEFHNCGPLDTDGDGINDGCDDCPSHPNPDQADSDLDGQGDACTIADCGGDPACADCDGNSIPDGCQLGVYLYWSSAESTLKRARSGGGAETVLCCAAPLDHTALFGGVAIDPIRGYLYSADAKWLFRADLDAPERSILVGILPDPTAEVGATDVELDLVNGAVYWVAHGLQIWRADLNGDAATQLLSFSPGASGSPPRIEGLAVDPANQRLYFSDHVDQAVKQTGLNGVPGPVAVRSGVNPSDVEVDTSTGMLYWIDRLAQKVFTAPANGSGQVEEVAAGTALRPGLYLDASSRLLYYVDGTEGVVKRVSLASGTIETVMTTYDSVNYLALAQVGSDCNQDQRLDACGPDPDADGIPDECDNCPLHYNPDQSDCDNDGTGDICSVATGLSQDCNSDGIPDGCQMGHDCNGNGTDDLTDLCAGTSGDCNGNTVPDECESSEDCNGNGVADICDIARGTSPDCNGNGVPDSCDIARGVSGDANRNDVPDECETDVPIYWTVEKAGDPGSIRRATVDGTAIEEIHCCARYNGHNATVLGSLAIDADNGYLYSGDGMYLFRTDLSGNSRQDLVAYSRGSWQQAILDVELDLVHSNVYWIEQYQCIRRAGLNGENPQVIYNTTYGYNLFCLAVDPTAGKLYIGCPRGDYGPAVLRTNLDGTGKETLWASSQIGAGTIHDLEIDVTSRKLFWSDPESSAIFRASADGAGDVEILLPGVRVGRGLYFDDLDRKLYYVDDRQTIRRLNPDGTGIETVVSGAARADWICNYKAVPRILHVRADSSPGGDGASWATAYRDLQSALDRAVALGGAGIEIWVAKGVYVPTRRTDPTDARSATFELPPGVSVFGGFAGTEAQLAERPSFPRPSVDPNETILSGAIGDPAGNAYHVVTGTGANRRSALDGFTIFGAQGDDAQTGGGLITLAGEARLRNCVFRGNTGTCALDLKSYGGQPVFDGIVLDSGGTGDECVAALSSSRVDLRGPLVLRTGWMESFSNQITNVTNDPDARLELAANTALVVRNNEACMAESILAVSVPVGPATVFDGNVWSIRNISVTDIWLTGSRRRWVVAPSSEGGVAATLTWQGNGLARDMSVGGRAHARFSSGGVLTLSGAVYEVDDSVPGSPTLVMRYDGVLITAEVGAFELRETAADSDRLAFVDGAEPAPLVSVTGGFLADNSHEFELSGTMRFSLPGFEASQPQAGGPVRDFTTGIDIPLIILPLEPYPFPEGTTILTAPIRGPGTIQINRGATLVVDTGGEINLTNNSLPSEPRGHVVVDGTLIARGRAKIQCTDVDVRLAKIGDAFIEYNDIFMVDTVGAGGEFFVEGNASIWNNTITSEGDRYLDLDPDPQSDHPSIVNNRLHVLIKEGVYGGQGTVLELRAKDYECEPGGSNPTYASGARQASVTGRFMTDPAQNWVLESLEIMPYAKVNLTNRPGFEFNPPHYLQDGTRVNETVYVESLILRENATLNTALQTLYYQRLVLVDHAGNETVWSDSPPYPETFSNGAKIVDVPLLGFSLAIIDMNDQTASPFNEFEIRVRRRSTDRHDANPPTGDPTYAGQVTLLPDARNANTHDGVMEMKTQADVKLSASSVAAKGSFARAGDESIVVAFEYLFKDNPAAEIIVKLSDKQEVGERSFAVARVRMPDVGKPGSIGSSEFATFYATFPRVTSQYTLKFARGTYVELELVASRDGEGNPLPSTVWIDNLDPQVICGYECASYDGIEGVTEADFLLLLAAYGRMLGVDDPKSCLDSKVARDHYVDISDLAGWDTLFEGALNACETIGAPATKAGGMLAPQAGGVTLPTSTFLVAGKPNSAGQQADLLYPVNNTGGSTGGSLPPAGGAGSRANGRLIQDNEGAVYQIHGTQGLIRLSDGQVMIPPPADPPPTFGGKTVYVGVRDAGGGEFAGVPMMDAAIRMTGTEAYAYVVPVLVSVPNDTPPHSYKAAAKLKITSPGQYTVEQLYGTDPYHDVKVTTTPPEASPYNAYSPREIELGRSGTYVFVLSAFGLNSNDRLLIYDEATAAKQEVLLSGLSTPLRGPTALLASSTADKLYVASVADTSTDGASLYRLSFSPSGPSVTSDGQVHITGVQQITAICEKAGDTALYVTGFQLPALAIESPEVWEDLPRSDPRYAQYFSNDSPIFTTPQWAQVPADVNWSASPVQQVSSRAMNGSDLALPLSAVFAPGGTASDFDGDGDVDLADFGFFRSCFNGPNRAAAQTGCGDADLDADTDVDLTDFGIFRSCFNGPNRPPACQ